jgi:putative FmdB family regulatory protein
MPTYEYRCGKCGHEFEREQRITEEPLKRCPSCRAGSVKRLISATSFVLKGGGWYSDLYASPKAKSDAGADKDAGATKPAADTGSKKDTTSKPASSEAPKPQKSGGSRKAAGTTAQ